MKHYRYIGGAAVSFPDIGGGVVEPGEIVATHVKIHKDDPRFAKATKADFEAQEKAKAAAEAGANAESAGDVPDSEV